MAGGYSSLYGDDVETGLFDKSGPSFEFAEKEIRLGFIRKVFGEYLCLVHS